LTSADARITFAVGNKRWAEDEVLETDKAFRQLVDRTSNTRLLKRADGSEMTFVRLSGSPSGFDALNMGDGRIEFYDSSFEPFASPSHRQNVLHEIAHNWDSVEEQSVFLGTQQLWSHFLTHSNWRTFWEFFMNPNTISIATNIPIYRFSDLVAMPVRHSSGWVGITDVNNETNYFNATDNAFARDYGIHSPRDDWATVWELYFRSETGVTLTTTNPVLQMKLQTVDFFFSSMRSGPRSSSTF
jgi:hypothetical protein